MKTFQEKIDELVDKEIRWQVSYCTNKEELIQFFMRRFAMSLDRLSEKLNPKTRFQADNQRALDILFKEG